MWRSGKIGSMVLMRTLLILIESKSKLFRGKINQHDNGDESRVLFLWYRCHSDNE